MLIGESPCSTFYYRLVSGRSCWKILLRGSYNTLFTSYILQFSFSLRFLISFNSIVWKTWWLYCTHFCTHAAHIIIYLYNAYVYFKYDGESIIYIYIYIIHTIYMKVPRPSVYTKSRFSMVRGLARVVRGTIQTGSRAYAKQQWSKRSIIYYYYYEEKKTRALAPENKYRVDRVVGL